MSKYLNLIILVSMMLFYQASWAAGRYNFDFPINAGWASPLGEKTMTTSSAYDFYSQTYAEVYRNGIQYEHAVVDIIASSGSKVYAIASGTVLGVRLKPDIEYDMSVITIKHQTSTGKNFCAIYGHTYSEMKVGDTISKGQDPKKYGFVDPLKWLEQNPVKKLSKVEVLFDESIDENSCTSMVVFGYYSDGSSEDITTKTRWKSLDS